MDALTYFSADYQEARAKFRAAARAAGPRLTAYENPVVGPDSGTLATDTAWLGPRDATRVLLACSGTHGVEGFCGAGAQSGWLASGLAAELPAGTALLQIHAINPHGFAWLRRVTEDNVDLNRNFVPHDGDYPANAGYEALRAALNPEEWNDAVIAETDRVLAAYAAEKGMRAFEEAFVAGQYSNSRGTFYGGQGATWSHRKLVEIFSEKLRDASKVAVIDYHTGLGPRGYGERITGYPEDAPALARARDWWGGDVTSTRMGTSTAVDSQGDVSLGMEAAAPHVEMTMITLEYGTRPPEEVGLALRAENWLHQHGELASAKGKAIKARLREAFYQDADDWKEMVWDRAVETNRAALKGLTEG